MTPFYFTLSPFWSRSFSKSISKQLRGLLCPISLGLTCAIKSCSLLGRIFNLQCLLQKVSVKGLDHIWATGRYSGNDSWADLVTHKEVVSHCCCSCCCHFSHVRLCATPEMAAHQAPPSLGFSRQEHWSGLPFPSPMHESEKWKWSHTVLSDS